MTIPISWFLNYSNPLVNKGRTTDVALFSKRKDALKFAGDNGVEGYMIRQDLDGNTFAGFVGAFMPSAQAYRELEALTSEWEALRYTDSPNALRYLCGEGVAIK